MDPMQGERGRAGGLRRAVVYGVWTAAVTLALLEILVRALGLAPRLPSQYVHYVDDPVLPHRPMPGSVAEGRSVTDEFDFRYVHNALGLRGPEVAVPKPTGAYRILVLGDSFTYGAGVDVEDTFAAVLERQLAARGPGHPRVEVVNAGIPRFFPEAQRLFLEHYGLPLEPDLVVVGFVANDVIDTHVGLEGIEVLPDGRLVSSYGARLLATLGPGLLALYEHWHTFRIPMRRWLQARIDDERPTRPSDVLRDGGYHEEDGREVERQYEAMVSLCREHGDEFVLVYLPQRAPWDEAAGYPARRLAAFSERAGVLFVDPLPAMRVHEAPETLHWPLDGHPTAAGHAMVAEVLRRALEDGDHIP
jgi:lysophospholipase L1-like esterase